MIITRELEELGALKEVEEAALAEAEAAAAEAANAALFDFDDDSDFEDGDKKKKRDKENGSTSENGGLVLNPKNLNEIKPITNQMEVARHENQFTNSGSRESLRYKVNMSGNSQLSIILVLHRTSSSSTRLSTGYLRGPPACWRTTSTSWTMTTRDRS